MSILVKIAKTQFSKDKKKVKLLRKIAVRVKVGSRTIDIFNDLANRRQSKFQNRALALLDPQFVFLDNARNIIAGGGKFSDCFDGWIDPTQYLLIKSGEKTGKIYDSILSCVELEVELREIKSAIKKALFMPIIGLIGCFSVLFGASVKGIPLFESILDPSQWGPIAESYRTLVDVVGGNPDNTIIVVVCIVVLYVVGIPNLDIPKYPKIRDTLDRILPFFGVYRTLNGSIFLKSLSSLLGSGVQIKEALYLIKETSGRYMRSRVNVMYEKVMSGKALKTIFETDFLGEGGEDLVDMSVGDDLERSIRVVAEESMKELTTELPERLKKIGFIIIMVSLACVFYGIAALYEIVEITKSNYS